MNIGVANDLHHFGYATRNIQKTEKLFQTLGFIAESELIHDELLGVSVKFYKANNSGTRIEIVAPIDNIDNPISSILTKRPGLYHIAFFSKDFSQTAKRLGLKSISESKPAKAFNGAHVQFFVSKDLTIIELIAK
jgi:methylmalonyl-CoA/ethylmalonyl-CoA epimerase